MIMTVRPTVEGREIGNWTAECALCEATVRSTYSTRHTARRGAADHLWSHRHGTINVERARERRAARDRYLQHEFDRAAKRHRPRRVTPLPVEGTCPTPNKRQHRSIEEGRQHIAALERNDRGNPDYNVYPCWCGWYHVGHSQEKFNKRLKNALNERG